MTLQTTLLGACCNHEVRAPGVFKLDCYYNLFTGHISLLLVASETRCVSVADSEVLAHLRSLRYSQWLMYLMQSDVKPSGSCLLPPASADFARHNHGKAYTKTWFVDCRTVWNCRWLKPYYSTMHTPKHSRLHDLVSRFSSMTVNESLLL